MANMHSNYKNYNKNETNKNQPYKKRDAINSPQTFLMERNLTLKMKKFWPFLFVFWQKPTLKQYKLKHRRFRLKPLNPYSMRPLPTYTHLPSLTPPPPPHTHTCSTRVAAHNVCATLAKATGSAGSRCVVDTSESSSAAGSFRSVWTCSACPEDISDGQGRRWHATQGLKMTTGYQHPQSMLEEPGTEST